MARGPEGHWVLGGEIKSSLALRRLLHLPSLGGCSRGSRGRGRSQRRGRRAPRTNASSDVILDKGDDIDLWCKTDNYWEWCKISHAGTNRSCEHVWRDDMVTEFESDDMVALSVYVRVGDCEDFEGRFQYIGDRGWKVYELDILNM